MDDKKSLILKEATTDFTEKDLEKLKAYEEAGMPGLGSVSDSQFVKMMQLYMAGKTYTQISSIMRMKKELVLVHSQKFKWFEAKHEILYEQEQSLKSRLIEASVTGQDFILQIKQLLEKKISHNIFKYLETEDESYANKINPKEIERYLKIVETLQGFLSEPGKPRQPASPIGLNLGEGMTLNKLGDGSIEITPKAKTIGDVLKQYADFKRQTEKEQNSVKTHDISNNEDKKQGENGNEDE